MSKNSNERQDTIFPSIHRLGINLGHRTARHRIVFFVISFIIVATICLFCDSMMIIVCNDTKILSEMQEKPQKSANKQAKKYRPILS